MALSLKDISCASVTRAPRIVLLGVEKIGENLDEQKGLARRRGKEAPFA